MQIWLKQSGSRLRIPVLPASYQVTSGHDNTALTVCNLGEISVFGKRGLRGISFSSFFPMRDDTYVEGSLKSPSYYAKKIESMKRAGTVKLTITGTPINMQCTIDNFEWGEEDGTGDIAYTLSLSEYIAPAIPTSVLLRADGTAADVASASGTQQTYEAYSGETGSRDEPSTESVTSYTVKSGDTLSAIARAFTGSAAWGSIYTANASVIGDNPNSIMPGMVLTIPNAKR